MVFIQSKQQVKILVKSLSVPDSKGISKIFRNMADVNEIGSSNDDMFKAFAKSSPNISTTAGIST